MREFFIDIGLPDAVAKHGDPAGVGVGWPTESFRYMRDALHAPIDANDPRAAREWSDTAAKALHEVYAAASNRNSEIKPAAARGLWILAEFDEFIAKRMDRSIYSLNRNMRCPFAVKLGKSGSELRVCVPGDGPDARWITLDALPADDAEAAKYFVTLFPEPPRQIVTIENQSNWVVPRLKELREPHAQRAAPALIPGDFSRIRFNRHRTRGPFEKQRIPRLHAGTLARGDNITDHQKADEIAKAVIPLMERVGGFPGPATPTVEKVTPYEVRRAADDRPCLDAEAENI